MHRSALHRDTMRRSGFVGTSSTPVPATELPDWGVDVCRYFLLDNDGGNDANVGYVDATFGTTAIVPTGLAKKTVTGTNGLLSILPRVGAGRTAVILIKNRALGATYATDGGDEALDLNGVSGYTRFLLRGSTDLTNSVTDRIMCGAITALAGPNVDGSWTVAAGATTSLFTVAAGSLPAEPTVASGVDTSITGYRVRFTGNVTSALANVCRAVQRNTTGAGAITPGENLSVAPAVGDTFFIERPGVRFTQFVDTEQVEGSQIQSPTQTAYAVAGIATTSTLARSFVIGSPGRTFYSFCEVSNPAALSTVIGMRSNTGTLSLRPQFRDDSDTQRDLGFGLRTPAYAPGAQAGYPIALVISARGLMVTGTSSGTQHKTQLQGQAVNALGGCYHGGGVTILCQGFGNVQSTFGAAAASTVQRTRIAGGSTDGVASGLQVQGPALVHGVAIAGNATTCVRVGQNANTINAARDGVWCTLDDLVTDTAGGNTGVGITIDTRKGSIRIGGRTACTVTGTLGDIRLGDGNVITPYATLTRTNVIDSLGNDVIGTAGNVVDQCVLVTMLAGPVALGDVMRSNGTTAQASRALADVLSTSNVVGVAVTSTAVASAQGYIAVAGAPSVNFNAGPTVGAVAWLSTSAQGTATTTEPTISGTQQKVRLGRVITASGSTGRVQLSIDSQPANTNNVSGRIVEANNAALAFAVGTAETIVVTGTITGNLAYTLPALSTVSENQIFELKDASTAGAFNLNLTPTGTDAIDLVNAAVPIVSGSKRALRVKKAPTVGWVLM